jgi:hypothetical protein
MSIVLSTKSADTVDGRNKAFECEQNYDDGSLGNDGFGHFIVNK